MPNAATKVLMCRYEGAQVPLQRWLNAIMSMLRRRNEPLKVP